MTYIRQMIMIIFAAIVFLALQYQYWFGTNGRGDLKQLNKQVSEQEYINSEQAKANEVLSADVKDLKNGVEAVEEHARVDLGLIKSGETFVQMSTADHVYTPDSTVHSADVATNNQTTATASSVASEAIYH